VTSLAAKLAFVLRGRTGSASNPAIVSGTGPGVSASDILNAVPGEAAVLRADGVIEAVNERWRSAAEAAGVPREANAFIGRNYLEVCTRAEANGSREAADARTGIGAVLNRSAPEYVAVYDMTHAGRPRWCELRATPRQAGGAVVLHLDVTARIRAEREAAERVRELMHLSRVLTAGTLSGALTHELNQPLTAILANAQAALRMLDTHRVDPAELRETVRDTIRSVQRASEIVQRTRNLLTRNVPPRQELDVNEVVQEAIRMLSNEALLRGVRLTVLRALDLPLVAGDPVQLQQCVINLVLNGFDAMADLPQADRHLLVHTNRVGYGAVEIVVEDRGSGIDTARLDRIFDPYYTTKPQGMGMGLYITREIVHRHGGRIAVKRNVDRGMRFRIVLPSIGSVDRTPGISVP